MVICTAVFQTAFSDFLMGSSKDLAKHIKVVVSEQAVFSYLRTLFIFLWRLKCLIMGMHQFFNILGPFSWSQWRERAERLDTALFSYYNREIGGNASQRQSYRTLCRERGYCTKNAVHSLHKCVEVWISPDCGCIWTLTKKKKLCAKIWFSACNIVWHPSLKYIYTYTYRYIKKTYMYSTKPRWKIFI